MREVGGEMEKGSREDSANLSELVLFREMVDRECLMGKIDRVMGGWWVQFVTAEGERTTPAIDKSLSKAIQQAIENFLSGGSRLKIVKGSRDFTMKCGAMVGDPDSSLLGHLEFEVKRNPSYPYELEQVVCICHGGPYYNISGRVVFDSVGQITQETITVGGVCFRIIDYRSITNRYLVRLDGRIAMVNYWLRRWTRVFGLAYRRLILTAAVWNLAESDKRCIPSWRDLRWPGKEVDAEVEDE